jgi:hypothetical protein
MIIKDLTYTIKKGMPNYSSVSAGMTVTVDNIDEIDSAWDYMKQECESQCNSDPSWINKEDEREKENNKIAQQRIEDTRR